MKSIDQLKENGFTVTKTKDLVTVIEHDNKFSVLKDSIKTPSIFNEQTNKYTITFQSLCSQGLVPNDIVLDNTSLLASINEASEMIQRKRAHSKSLPSIKQLPTTFDKVAVGENFYRDAEGKIAYQKVSETTARKNAGIASVLEIVLSESDSVFVDYDDQFGTLTADQKWDLVFAVPETATPLQARTIFMSDLDQIPGVEELSDADKTNLVNELMQMWNHHNGH